MKNEANIQTERIAISREGKAVTLVKVTSSESLGSDARKLRVMLFAQQHGDEPSGKEALLLLLTKAFSGKLNDLLERVDLLIIPQVNPDGSERRQRRTADGIDLNRSHVLLNSPEVRALHNLFHAWLPQVTLDIHEYCSYNSRWVESGMIRTADVQMGTLTNLNSSPAIRAYQRGRVLPFVASTMHRQGFQFNEYIVGSPSSGVRHSTTEINDGRQSFGLLNTLSFLQEGRKWRGYSEKLEHRALTQLVSIEALLDFCRLNADEILELVARERRSLSGLAGKQMVARMEHVTEGEPRMEIPGCDTHLGKETTLSLFPYRNAVRSLRTVPIPSAYVIPAEHASVAGVLSAHHVRVVPMERRKKVPVSVSVIREIDREVLEGQTLAKPRVHTESALHTLSPGDLIVPTSQIHALFVATLLEPESMWGLARYPEYASLMTEGVFPFVRVMQEQDSTESR
jgi:hypothetical protein